MLDKLLLLRLSSFKLNNFPIVEGIVSFNVLLCKYKYSNLIKSSMGDGKGLSK